MRTAILAVQLCESICVEFAELTRTVWCVAGSYDGPAVTRSKYLSAIVLDEDQFMMINGVTCCSPMAEESKEKLGPK